MRIRPLKLENSICDAKYHVSLGLITTQNYNLNLASNLEKPPPFSSKASRRRPPPKRRRPPPPHVDRTCSDHHFEEFPSVMILPCFVVQVDERTLLPVVDLIRRNLPPPTVKSQSPCDSGLSQAPVASKTGSGSATVFQQEKPTAGSCSQNVVASESLSALFRPSQLKYQRLKSTSALLLLPTKTQRLKYPIRC
ncbi:auxin-like 1 protein [Dorcoceras hygrometricum]|uniref:Auxin-like 1 protein n=1 Tax=Dorcoceras hygrometricum TaxID=472368 RepID=A0A2Z7DGD8_9LAMI|nr:auxin-like 1 protein [Dorcoceras hygrometricum]